MEAQEVSPMVGEMIVWARMGGYSTLIVFILSVVITVLGFMRRATAVAWGFLLITILMACSMALMRLGFTLVAIHVAQIGRILPYVLLLWMLAKAKSDRVVLPSPATCGRVADQARGQEVKAMLQFIAAVEAALFGVFISRQWLRMPFRLMPFAVPLIPFVAVTAALIAMDGVGKSPVPKAPHTISRPG